MTKKTTRKLGRPPGVKQPRFLQIRTNDEFIRSIDDWRRQQADLPSRTEALRRLVEIALKTRQRS